MKRLLALLAGGLGLGAWLRRRKRRAELDSPAEQLRAKLAESKTAEPEAEAVAEPAHAVEPEPVAEPEPDPEPEQEPAAEEPEAPEVSARRADVHARARRAIDELGSEQD